MANSYNLDNRTGSIVDRISSTPATLTNSSLQRTEKGYGLSFNGVSSTINTNVLGSAVLGDNCSIEVWFIIRKASAAQYLFMSSRSVGSSFMSLLVEGDIIKGYYANNAAGVDTTSISSTTTIKLNTPYHVVFKRTNATDMSLHVNSVQEDSSVNGGQSPAAINMVLGATTTGSAWLDGIIIVSRTYNTALSQTEINRLYADFLASKLIGKAKRGFKYYPPTDLSNEVNNTLSTNVVTDPNFLNWNGGAPPASILLDWTDTDQGDDYYIYNATPGVGFSVQDGQSICVSQNAMTIGKRYLLSATGYITGTALDSIKIQDGDAPILLTFDVGMTTSTTQSVVFIAASTELRICTSGDATAGVITNVSLQEITGLAAAYNMVQTRQTLIDISGNGNNMTCVNTLQTQNGLAFNGVNSKATCTAISAIDVTKDFSIFMRFKTPTDITTEQSIMESSTGLTNCHALQILSSSVRIGNYDATNFRGNQSNAIIANQVYDLVYIWDATAGTGIGYLNGVAMTGTTGPAHLTSGSITSFGLSVGGTNYPFKGEILDTPKVLNRKATLQEAKDYHNKYARQVKFRECFCDLPADGVTVFSIPNWITTSGTWKAGELTIASGNYGGLPKGQKYIECVTSGVIAIPSESAFNAWEFDFYKGSTDNRIDVAFINDRFSFAVNTTNGYYFSFDESELVRFAINQTTGATTLFTTASSYLAISTWYRARITRTKAGSFTVLMKGGSLTPTAGYDGWTLVSVSGGSGTNPVTNTVHSTSSYFAFKGGAGDRITNITNFDETIVI